MTSFDDDFAVPSPSHLQVADLAFTALSSEPRLLSLDCTELAGRLPHGPQLGLPCGEVLLCDLRQWMKTTRTTTRMAMPGLIRHAGALARDFDGDPADIDAAIVEGFLEALLRRVEVVEPGVYAKLCWAGYRARHLVRYADSDVDYRDDLDTEAFAPHRPYGHVDLLLAQAVALGVVTQDDADLIIDIRLDYQPIEDIARRAGAEPDALRRRRQRAGQRIADALTGMVSQARTPRKRQHRHQSRTYIGTAAPHRCAPLSRRGGSECGVALQPERAHRTS